MTRAYKAGALALALALTATAGRPAAARPATAARAPAQDFQATWARFRAAVLAHDMRGVAALTAFPLALHGSTDDGASRLDRANFARAFAKMLAQHPDGAGTPSNLDRIRATPSLKDPGFGKVASLSGLEFGRTPAGPRLVRIFVEDE